MTPSIHKQVPDSQFRATWAWIGSQAISGLEEGVRHREVWDLGAKG